MKKITIKKQQKKTVTLTDPGTYEIELVGEGAEVEIIGAFTTEKKEKIDVTVIIHHTAPHTRANTVLKGVAEDESFIRFVGRIIIDKNCPDTQSFLEERVLLVSDQACAETVPDLEIESDDVKCSHAASISTVDQQQLFYLMSRGINKKTAQKMIVEGFLNIL